MHEGDIKRFEDRLYACDRIFQHINAEISNIDFHFGADLMSRTRKRSDDYYAAYRRSNSEK